MQNPTRIPDLFNRERFAKRVLATDKIFFVSGDAGWASVPFRHNTARDVVLFWASRSETERWADVVASNAVIHEVPLAVYMSDILPMLDTRNCLVGPDWNSEPSDPVVEPADLLERLWREHGEQFLAAIKQNDCVWVLESASGPAFLPSQRAAGKEFLPVWANREQAEFHIAGSWAVKRPIGVALSVFRDRYLPFLEQRGWLIGPDPMPAVGTRELTTAEFSNRAYPSVALSQLRAV